MSFEESERKKKRFQLRLSKRGPPTCPVCSLVENSPQPQSPDEQGAAGEQKVPPKQGECKRKQKDIRCKLPFIAPC